ncbi:hypothetical protein [Coleofasciculus chthonoplastes]|uniref:hypothetical protein n=1 Tax=Coleofasciculus chthonoplastes TaxID=64178 RepID=UPI0032F76F96
MPIAYETPSVLLSEVEVSVRLRRSASAQSSRAHAEVRGVPYSLSPPQDLFSRP